MLRAKYHPSEAHEGGTCMQYKDVTFLLSSLDSSQNKMATKEAHLNKKINMYCPNSHACRLHALRRMAQAKM